jgi:hypothetical protein
VQTALKVYQKCQNHAQTRPGPITTVASFRLTIGLLKFAENSSVIASLIFSLLLLPQQKAVQKERGSHSNLLHKHTTTTRNTMRDSCNITARPGELSKSPYHSTRSNLIANKQLHSNVAINKPEVHFVPNPISMHQPNIITRLTNSMSAADHDPNHRHDLAARTNYEASRLSTSIPSDHKIASLLNTHLPLIDSTSAATSAATSQAPSLLSSQLHCWLNFTSSLLPPSSQSPPIAPTPPPPQPPSLPTPLPITFSPFFAYYLRQLAQLAQLYSTDSAPIFSPLSRLLSGQPQPHTSNQALFTSTPLTSQLHSNSLPIPIGLLATSLDSPLSSTSGSSVASYKRNSLCSVPLLFSTPEVTSSANHVSISGLTGDSSPASSATLSLSCSMPTV